MSICPPYPTFDGRRGGSGASVRGLPPLPADWHGLAERLAAAHALRQVLASDEDCALPAGSGSFDAAVARTLAAAAPRGDAGEDDCTGINPFASSDGKGPRGKDTRPAGTQYPAGEG